MRRPLKPFVTEYKGRGSQPLAARRAHEDHATPPPVNETFLRHAAEATHQADDSYEAAMRAADALFSNGQRAGATAASAAASAEAAPKHLNETPRGGRILRAIDEPPLPGLAELEAERAPKRRGRKPGSKNKPKVLEAARAALRPAALDYQWPDEDETPAAPLSRPQLPAPVARAHPAGAAGAVVTKRQPTAPLDYTARQEGRFAWVRTKLQPGQQWKRRLPKVCW